MTDAKREYQDIEELLEQLRADLRDREPDIMPSTETLIEIAVEIVIVDEQLKDESGSGTSGQVVCKIPDEPVV